MQRLNVDQRIARDEKNVARGTPASQLHICRRAAADTDVETNNCVQLTVLTVKL